MAAIIAIVAPILIAFVAFIGYVASVRWRSYSPHLFRQRFR